MAGPFDISSYDTAISADAGVNPEVLARANRAARVAKFGEGTVARMETAGRLFGGATPSPAAAPAAAAMAPVEAAPMTRFARLRSMLNPNITARGIGRLAGGIGRTSAIAAPALAAVQSLTDTPESVAALGESVGIDTGTTAGRVGANVLNFARNVGDYASFGVAPRVGRMLTGGSFFDPVAPAQPNALVTDQGLPTGPQAPVANLGATPGVSRVTTPDRMAAADAALTGPYTGDQPVGTGFMRNNATGDTREFTGGGATPSAAPARAANDKYGFGELITGLKESHRRAAATAARAAEGAYLRGEAAFMKAEEGNNKPENTTVIPGLPGQPPEVIQVNRGAAKKLTVRQELPPGYTVASARAEGMAALKAGGDKKMLDAIQAKFGLPPLPALK